MTDGGQADDALNDKHVPVTLRPSQIPHRLPWDRTCGIRDLIFINIRPVTPLHIAAAAASTSYTGTGHKTHEAYHKRRASM